MPARFLITFAVLLVGPLGLTEAKPPAKPKMVQKTYPVADLVIPLVNDKDTTDFNLVKLTGKPVDTKATYGIWSAGGQSIEFTEPVPVPAEPKRTLEDRLMKLITSTIAPQSWSENGGPGAIDYFPLGMGLVINQTADVHQQIEQLLTGLRQIQDAQVTVEVRVIRTSEAFFERLAMDADINLKEKAPEGLERISNDLENIPKKEHEAAVRPTPASVQGEPGTVRDESVNQALLSDVQAFLLLEAVAGDPRTNILQTPKLIVFNGQTGMLNVADQPLAVVTNEKGKGLRRPGSGGKDLTPATGMRLAVRPVISADRRFVHLNVKADLTSVNERTMNEESKLNALAVETAVKVPDGGSVLIGGWKNLREARQAGKGYGRETEQVLLLVTPRIVIHSEEEQKIQPPACGAPARTKAAEKHQDCPSFDVEEQQARGRSRNPDIKAVSAKDKQAEELAADLVAAYHRACAAGYRDHARDLARMALSLDPMCFSKWQDVKQQSKMDKLLNQSEGHGFGEKWQRPWFTEQPSHLTPVRVHGGIE
jgi:hypothetical protein